MDADLGPPGKCVSGIFFILAFSVRRRVRFRCRSWRLVVCAQARWTVGKLNCHSCSARLGGFDFIHHFECPCGQDAAVHLNKSRVDPEHKPRFSTVQPRAVKPTKEQSHRPMVESQREESTRDSTRLPWSQPKHATAISSPPVCSESGSTSGNS